MSVQMNMIEFNTLPLQYRAQFIWDTGVFLVSRQTDKHVVHLYHMKDFFVEVYFSIKNEGVDMISSFKSTIQLDPYLEQISAKL